MNHTLKKCFLKLGASFLLVGLVAMSALATHGNMAFATSCTGLTGGFFSPGATGCDMSITTTFPSGALAFTNDATATIDTPATTAGTAGYFDFHTDISDDRNTATTTGWRLQATSTGLANAGTPAASHVGLTLGVGGTGHTSISTCTLTGGGACPLDVVSTFSQPTLNSTTSGPSTFLDTTYGATNTPPGAAISAIFATNTFGSFTFATTDPAGVWSGTITVALLDTP
jgi:hypothetical protein